MDPRLGKDQIILLGRRFNNMRYPKAYQLFFLIIGISIITLAIHKIQLHSSVTSISIILILNGLILIGYGGIMLNKNSRFAPKITVNSKQLSIKNSLFKKPFVYKWEDIDYISFDQKDITIHYSTKSNTIYYKSSKSNTEKANKLIQKEAIAQKTPIMG